MADPDPLDPNIRSRYGLSDYQKQVDAFKNSGTEMVTFMGDELKEVTLPKKEYEIGSPLSPYAITKYVNELYADIFSKTYGLETIGLRYFNVFGKMQDPNGPYAAVIPKWAEAMINKRNININGDGKTSRDFCYVENVVQANLLAATSASEDALIPSSIVTNKLSSSNFV